MAPELVIALAIVGIVVGLVGAGSMVARLVRIARQTELGRVPIAAVQPVTFGETGRAELALEGPLFTTRLRGLAFELVDPTGMAVPLGRLWMRTSSSGFSRARVSLERLEIPRPGTYELRTTGIAPDTDYTGCAVVFVRPIGAALAVTIPALLASIGIAAASIAVAGVFLFGGAPEDPSRPTTAAVPARAVPAIDAHGGRSLAVDARRLAGGQDVVWPLLRMRVRVPADWIVRKISATELDLRHPTTPSTFVVARATPMPAGPSFDDYLRAHVEHAREQLATRLVEGYATKRIGAVPGVLTIETRGERTAWMIDWTGFQPAELGSVSVTVLAGAAADDFARDEGLLGAIVESIRFE